MGPGLLGQVLEGVLRLSAWSVTDREEWNSLSLPRCTSSRRRLTSSKCDLRLGRQGAAPLEGQCSAPTRSGPSATPGCGPPAPPVSLQMHRQVHGSAGGHQSLQETGRKTAGPLAQVQGADQAAANAYVSPVDLHLQLDVLVAFDGRTAQGSRKPEQAQLLPRQGKDPRPPRARSPCSSSMRPCSQTA